MDWASVESSGESKPLSKDVKASSSKIDCKASARALHIRQDAVDVDFSNESHGVVDQQSLIHVRSPHPELPACAASPAMVPQPTPNSTEVIAAGGLQPKF
jgi:hypothetical protein